MKFGVGRYDGLLTGKRACGLGKPDLEGGIWALLTERLRAGCQRQYRFHPMRKWRFDFAWPACLLAVEIEGGTWNQGGHVRGRQFANDAEKQTAAAVMGWRVMRFTTDQLRKLGPAVVDIIEAGLNWPEEIAQ